MSSQNPDKREIIIQQAIHPNAQPIHPNAPIIQPVVQQNIKLNQWFITRLRKQKGVQSKCKGCKKLTEVGKWLMA